MDTCNKALFTFQIKKEETKKRVVFPYSRPLPCLCIEVTLQPPVLVLSTYELSHLFNGLNFIDSLKISSQGWSALVDAPRVQVCPFKDRESLISIYYLKTDTASLEEIVTSADCDAGLEELWFGVTFDPLEQTLSWEPACPVTAALALCQKTENGVCVALPQTSQNVSREKVEAFKMLKLLLFFFLLFSISSCRGWSQFIKV